MSGLTCICVEKEMILKYDENETNLVDFEI